MGKQRSEWTDINSSKMDEWQDRQIDRWTCEQTDSTWMDRKNDQFGGGGGILVYEPLTALLVDWLL